MCAATQQRLKQRRGWWWVRSRAATCAGDLFECLQPILLPSETRTHNQNEKGERQTARAATLAAVLHGIPHAMPWLAARGAHLLLRGGALRARLANASRSRAVSGRAGTTVRVSRGGQPPPRHRQIRFLELVGRCAARTLDVVPHRPEQPHDLGRPNARPRTSRHRRRRQLTEPTGASGAAGDLPVRVAPGRGHGTRRSDSQSLWTRPCAAGREKEEGWLGCVRG
jgi:hypothetical protein